MRTETAEPQLSVQTVAASYRGRKKTSREVRYYWIAQVCKHTMIKCGKQILRTLTRAMLLEARRDLFSPVKYHM